MPPQAAEGVHFHRPQGGWLVFHRAKPGCMVWLRSSIYNGARQGAHLASAAILYNYPGRMPSNRPGGEAGPGQNRRPRAKPGGCLHLLNPLRFGNTVSSPTVFTPLSEANTTLLYNLRRSRAPSKVREYSRPPLCPIFCPSSPFSLSFLFSYPFSRAFFPSFPF